MTINIEIDLTNKQTLIKKNLKMKQIALKKLVQDRVVTNISSLRENENGYPYVTLLVGTPDGTASQNVYFGQKTATIVSDSFKVGDNILSMLADAQVIETKNADGEIRYKLSINPTSDYASETSMADVFGIELTSDNFDVKAFQKGFQTRQSTTVNAGVDA